MIQPLISICLTLCLMLSLPLRAAEPAEGSVSPYFAIEDPFTINFLKQSDDKMRYLQIKVALKSDDPAIIQSAQTHLPMIQDSLRLLFTDQSYATITSVAGRELLQQQALERIRSLLAEETGNDALEQVYFTRFILQ
ncbi:MAG: flagellar basal body-associated FliL family protein [Pseudomonadota bacterium]|nr:flagellar basal body-associated FliL family protein [Pseudomonadota bacterium]